MRPRKGPSTPSAVHHLKLAEQGQSGVHRFPPMCVRALCLPYEPSLFSLDGANSTSKNTNEWKGQMLTHHLPLELRRLPPTVVSSPGLWHHPFFFQTSLSAKMGLTLLGMTGASLVQCSALLEGSQRLELMAA